MGVRRLHSFARTSEILPWSGQIAPRSRSWRQIWPLRPLVPARECEHAGFPAQTVPSKRETLKRIVSGGDLKERTRFETCHSVRGLFSSACKDLAHITREDW